MCQPFIISLFRMQLKNRPGIYQYTKIVISRMTIRFSLKEKQQKELAARMPEWI